MEHGSFSIYRIFGKHGDYRVLINSFPTPDQCINYLKILQLRYPEACFATVFEQKDYGLQTSNTNTQQELPF